MDYHFGDIGDSPIFDWASPDCRADSPGPDLDLVIKLTGEREEVRLERERLRVDRDRLTEERDSLAEERKGLHRDAQNVITRLLSRKHELEAANAQLRMQLSEMRAEESSRRRASAAQKPELVMTRDLLDLACAIIEGRVASFAPVRDRDAISATLYGLSKVPGPLSAAATTLYNALH